MSKRKCGFCGKSLKERKEDFKTSIINPKTNKHIVVKKVKDYICSDKKCEYGFLPFEEEKRITNQVERERRYYLAEDEITLLREKIADYLGFDSKYQVASFLCLNEKTFTRWEKAEYENIKKSTELLIRLVAHSKENIDFIKKLHRTKFEFKSSHYGVLRDNLHSLPTKALEKVRT